MKQLTNPCTRCGKERILLKQWDEVIPTFGNSTTMVTRSTNICPDPECQKVVDAELAVQRKKRDKIKSDREEKLQQVADKKQADKDKLLEDEE
ncbi:MAG: hypothetical protein H0W89_05740 [Candidatus Levybacteria bacterium]|nr:hypothetical protein [Candidatus Levybacteria bacterium]